MIFSWRARRSEPSKQEPARPIAAGGHPYENLPLEAYWRTGVAGVAPLEIANLARPKRRLRREDRIGSGGSCFAQHIARHLRGRGFTFVDAEPAPSLMPPDVRRAFGFGVYSARYANIYTTAQLRQLIERAYRKRKPAEHVWTGGGRFYDPFRTQIEPNGFASAAEVEADVASHLRKVRWLFGQIDVFVFTLGLTEAWRSKVDGTVYPIAPGVGGVGTFDPAIHEFVNFSYPEVRRDLAWSIGFLRRINPKLRFILTVSPVPLAATASGGHVLCATMHSKSILRAVAGQLAADLDCVDYFPSYEMVSAPAFGGMFFEANKRDVSADGVDHVMATFTREFCDEDDGFVPAIESDEIERDLVCEEKVLDFYAEKA